MKAVVIAEHGGVQNLVYEDIETPEPGPGEVLVRVRAAGVNHFDHDIREGTSGIVQALPHIPGVEGVGEVAELGADVTDAEVGARVAIGFYQSCGVCRMCRSGFDGICEKGKRIGVTEWGTYAEYIRCESRNLIPLPDGLDYETAAASLICFPTAWHMSVTLGGVKAGQDVLVNAAGSGVGVASRVSSGSIAADTVASASSSMSTRNARAPNRSSWPFLRLVSATFRLLT